MRTRQLVAAVAVVTLLGACTADDDPDAATEPPVAVEDDAASGSMGAEVAVILPPAGSLDAAAAEALDRQAATLGDDLPRGIDGVSVHVPESTTFARDLAGVFGDRGVDLVCFLGPDAVSVVTSSAERYPATQYCASPADRPDDGAAEFEGEPVDQGEDVTRLEVRAEELGHVVGVGARRAAGDGSVGLLLSGDELPDSRFEAGLEAGLTGVEVVRPDDVDEELEPDAAAEEQAQTLLDAGATVVVVDGAAGSSAAVAALADQVVLLGPAGVLDAADVDDRVVLTWTTRWDRVFGPLVEAVVEEDTDVRTFGIVEEAFEVDAGAAASTSTGAAVADALADLAEGSRDPLSPAPGSGLAAMRPSGNADDDADEDEDDDQDAEDDGSDAPDDADDDASDDGEDDDTEGS